MPADLSLSTSKSKFVDSCVTKMKCSTEAVLTSISWSAVGQVSIAR